MKTNLVRALGPLLCCGLLLFATTANAFTQQNIQVTPLVDLVVRDTSGKVVMRSRTDARGFVKINDLAPGSYVAEIDGASLVKAIDKLVPPTPAKHDSGPSVGLSVGGLFGGGGSHHSNEGGGPVGGSHNDSHDGGSTGGVSLGVNVPLGGASPPGLAIGGIETVVVTAQFLNGVSPKSGPGELIFSSATPYCREVAGGGMHFEFTVPTGSGAQGANVFSEDPRVVGVSVGASW